MADIDKCLKYVDNRFVLVLLASQKVRDIMRGEGSSTPLINKKSTVAALEYIESGSADIKALEKSLSNFYQEMEGLAGKDGDFQECEIGDELTEEGLISNFIMRDSDE